MMSSTSFSTTSGHELLANSIEKAMAELYEIKDNESAILLDNSETFKSRIDACEPMMQTMSQDYFEYEHVLSSIDQQVAANHTARTMAYDTIQGLNADLVVLENLERKHGRQAFIDSRKKILTLKQETDEELDEITSIASDLIRDRIATRRMVYLRIEKSFSNVQAYMK